MALSDEFGYRIPDPFASFLHLGDGTLSDETARVLAALLIEAVPELRDRGLTVDALIEESRMVAAARN